MRRLLNYRWYAGHRMITAFGSGGNDKVSECRPPTPSQPEGPSASGLTQDAAKAVLENEVTGHS
jgi:hypothetical protein